jgi:hypothetical protein
LDSFINIYWIYKFIVFIVFRDRNDTTKQVWEPKCVFCKFRDIVERVWGPKRMIYEFSDWTTQINKFKNLNDRFMILEIEMTQPKKFQHRGLYSSCNYRCLVSWIMSLSWRQLAMHLYSLVARIPKSNKVKLNVVRV